ncbi:MAG: Gfo/Idh/MocA family oxidoreductase [Rhizomicrobium sp.]|nr:Gfo/Idh/MocA family oxidoreductase [Rhizomicrobium sp.]
MQPIRVGVVGLGKIALEEHVPALLADSAYSLAACVSSCARLEGVPHFPTIEAMLDSCPDIDAVAICTPPQAHYEAAKYALERNKHVLLEKPPCPTLEEFDDLVDIAQRNNCTLFQTWHARETVAVDAAARWAAERQLRSGQILWKEDVRQWHPQQAWIWQEGGFGVVDAGINAISILTKILPGAISVKTAHLLVPANCESPIAASVVFGTAAGALINAEFDFRHRGAQVRSIALESGSDTLNLVLDGAKLDRDGTPLSPESQQHEYAVLYRRFAELVGRRESDADKRPLALAIAIFRQAERSIIEPFQE